MYKSEFCVCVNELAGCMFVVSLVVFGEDHEYNMFSSFNFVQFSNSY
jgi:hypothetical protein